MMAGSFFLEIIVPDRKFFADEVEMVTLKTPAGEIGVMCNHMPLVAAVQIGSIKILQKGKWLEAFVSEGFIEVMQHKTVIVADSADWPEEIDTNRARAAEERARERLQRQLSQMEYARSQAALQRALSRLKVTKAIK